MDFGGMGLIIEILSLKLSAFSSDSSAVSVECGEDLCLGSLCHRRAKYLKRAWLWRSPDFDFENT